MASYEEADRDALIGAVTLLERSIAYLLGNLQLVNPGLLSRRTPCDGWDLGTLLWHVADSFGVLGPPSFEDQDPILAVRDAARATLGRWSAARDPGSVWIGDLPLSAPIVVTAGAIEITAHGWDIARACGWRRPVPAGLAEEMLELLPLFVAPPYRYRCFAPAVSVPDRDCAGDRLIASLGRRPPDPVERRYLQSRAALLMASSAHSSE